jgi:hypothetical protein
LIALNAQGYLENNSGLSVREIQLEVGPDERQNFAVRGKGDKKKHVIGWFWIRKLKEHFWIDNSGIPCKDLTRRVFERNGTQTTNCSHMYPVIPYEESSRSFFY